MTWRLTEWGKTRLPLPGIPWRDMSDAEFAEALVVYPDLRSRRYFAHLAETREPATLPAPRFAPAQLPEMGRTRRSSKR